ncbi:MAG: pilus assembly protein [Pseudomonadota bacterium]|nr:pilus assembly protein [Pseudomonadota bacterium]
MLLRRLRSDRRGTAVIEFAIIAPVMMIIIMGLSDLMYQIYAQSILNGAVQKAGRDSGIQGGDQQATTIDARVISQVANIMSNPTQACPTTSTGGATWCSTRKNYDTFKAIAPEPFTDLNGDGIRQPGECYSDINGNHQWDADPGTTGQGGADDVTVYTMTITYPRIFPVAGLLGWPSTQTISATTTLKNQPYANQTTTTVATICT